MTQRKKENELDPNTQLEKLTLAQPQRKSALSRIADVAPPVKRRQLSGFSPPKNDRLLNGSKHRTFFAAGGGGHGGRGPRAP